MFNPGAALAMVRVDCVLAAVCVCAIFLQLFRDWAADMVRYRQSSNALQLSAGIWITAAGTVVFTSYRSVEIFLFHRMDACLVTGTGWVLAGYPLMTVGYFLHIIGKTKNDGCGYGGVFLCALITLIGLAAYGMAMSVGCR